MTTETKTETIFHKIERPQFDEMLTFGSREFIATLADRTTEELRIAEQNLNAIRSLKTKNTYFVFPVSTPKQQAAGKLYFTAFSNITKALRAELANRVSTSLFTRPERVEAEPVAA